MKTSKESLRGLSVQQLEGKLMDAKARFAEASTQLSAARQSQILKTKQIKGKASARKKELISQILELERQTARVEAQRSKITIGENIKFNIDISKAAKKVAMRAVELKTTGTYQTPLTGYEKVLEWCMDMGVDRETFYELLKIYSIEELSNMSGDDFYDEVNSIMRSEEIQRRIDDESAESRTITF